MAFTFGEGGRRGRRFGSSDPLAEINIVPLVDVVLVLLVLFMITANVMDFGLDINVPEGENRARYREGTARCQHHQDW